MSLNIFEESRYNDEDNLRFKAGIMHYNKITKMVSSDIRKGFIDVKRDENGYTEFSWMERDKEKPELKFLLLPGDAEYRQVKESGSGRVYLLDIKTSDEKRFFWMQETSSKYDEMLTRRINELISGKSLMDDPIQLLASRMNVIKLIKPKELMSFILGTDGIDDDDEEDYEVEEEDSSSVGGEFIALDDEFGIQGPILSPNETNLFEVLLENIPEDEHKSAMDILLSTQHDEAMERLEEAHINGNLQTLLNSYRIDIPSGRGGSTRINDFLIEIKKRINEDKEAKGKGA